MATFYLDPIGGADTATDLSPSARVMLEPGGGAVIDQTHVKFGQYALNLLAGGTDARQSAGVTDAGLQFGNGQFTVEAWCWWDNTVASNAEYICGNIASTSNHGFVIGKNTANSLIFGYSLDGTNLLAVGAAWTPPTGQWIHIAADRDASNVVRVYAGGAVIASGTVSGTLYPSTRTFYIGNDGNLTRALPGWIGGLRITKGVARYAGAFTPPTAAFPVGPSDPYWSSVTLLLNYDTNGDGLSFQNRWKTLEAGATAARIAPGDTIRIIASPDETLVGDATWTQGSNVVTLPAPVTSVISECETVWTASTNVTASITTSNKVGVRASTLVPATAFTTGKLGYTTLNSITNTTKTGISSGTAEGSAANICDGNATTRWSSTAYVSGSTYFGIQFGAATTVHTFSLRARTDGWIEQSPTAWALQGSNNGTDWATIQSYTTPANWVLGETRQFTVNTPTAYTYLRCLVSDLQGPSKVSCSILEFDVFNSDVLDLSAYQQVSFWIKATATLPAGALRLALCSDSIGSTVVQNIAVPALQNGQFYPVVVDTGAALPASLQSIALYADVDPGTPTITIDNIVACKASSSPDSLTHHSLIGKVHNKSWAATTAYALNTKRRPTQPNRNGFQYKVTTAGTSGATEPTWPIGYGNTVLDGTVVWTCVELEDSWFPISGFTNSGDVVLDAGPGNSKTSIDTVGYHGETETIATYKREPTLLTPAPNITNTNVVQEGGTLAGGNITYIGGWDRTNMSTQVGETWWSGTNGNGNCIHMVSFSYLTISHMHGVRFGKGLYSTGTSAVGSRLLNCHMNGMSDDSFEIYSASLEVQGIHAFRNSRAGVNFENSKEVTGVAVQASSNVCGSPTNAICPANRKTRLSYVSAFYNGAVGVGVISLSAVDAIVYNLHTKGNTYSVAHSSGSGVAAYSSNLHLINALCEEPTFIHTFGFSSDSRDGVCSHNHNRISGAHLNYFYDGVIRSVTDVRNTASGLAWKFNVTGTSRTRNNPLRMSVLKLQVTAGTPYSVRIYTRRDNANIKGYLHMDGLQVAGVPDTITVPCDPIALNTWEQSSPLTFTPTEDGVVEIEFKVYCESGTTHSYWIDDLSVS